MPICKAKVMNILGFWRNLEMLVLNEFFELKSRLKIQAAFLL